MGTLRFAHPHKGTLGVAITSRDSRNVVPGPAIVPRTAIVRICRTDDATIANHGSSRNLRRRHSKPARSHHDSIRRNRRGHIRRRSTPDRSRSIAGTVGVSVRSDAHRSPRPRSIRRPRPGKSPAAPAPSAPVSLRRRRCRYRCQTQDRRSGQSQRCFPHGVLLFVKHQPHYIERSSTSAKTHTR